MEHQHYSHRTGWLRAAVLGANDGIVSTAALIVGVAGAGTGPRELLLAGIAGLVAGAMSMAAGEYVSVSSQSDTEAADLAKEREWLEAHPEYELDELAKIYVERGVAPDLAREVARQMMEKDALGAHARDEIGITEVGAVSPIRAAMASALSFTSGGIIPLLVALPALGQPPLVVIAVVVAASLLSLALLGVLSARAGGAPVLRAVLRVTFGGALAMAITALVGKLVGAAV